MRKSPKGKERVQKQISTSCRQAKMLKKINEKQIYLMILSDFVHSFLQLIKYKMNFQHRCSDSSFSSFESQSNCAHLQRTKTAYFSQFSQAENMKNHAQDYQIPFVEKRRQQKEKIKKINNRLAEIQEENKILRRQNELLKKQNDLLKSQNSKIKDVNEDLTKKIKHMEKQEVKQKQKYLELVKEVKKLKDSFVVLKQTQEKRNQKIEELRNELREIKKKKAEEEWKDRFVELFEDMIMKISQQIDEKWSSRKKIQIGWKIVKIIIKKTVNEGFTMPRVIKNSVDTTHLSEYNRNG